MELTGEEIEQLIEALLSAFPTLISLEMMTRTKLDERLAHIAGGSNLKEIVFNLIQWAESYGRMEDLVAYAIAANPGNYKLNTFLAQHDASLRQIPNERLSWKRQEPL